MAVQLINVGNVANDGTGDDLREAFIIVNQNFEELDLRDDEQTTASNIGATGVGIFANKVNYDLQFKKLVAGTDITLTPTTDTIVVAANGGLKTLLITSNSGSKILTETDNLNIYGGVGITTTLVGDTLTINNTASEVVTDTTPQLGGNLDAQTFNITNVGTIDATNVISSFTGNLTGLVYGVDIRDINQYFDANFDFGSIGANINNIFEWIISSADVDFGTILSPELRTIDGGLLTS